MKLREVALLRLETMVPSHFARLAKGAAVPLHPVLFAVDAHVHLHHLPTRETFSSRKTPRLRNLGYKIHGELSAFLQRVALSSQACSELVEAERG
jgi:hypothetical protein